MAYQGIGIRFVSLQIDGILIGFLFGALGTILGVGMKAAALTIRP
jgi:hypothetical protein